MSLKQEEIPPQQEAVEKTSDLLETLKPTGDLPEPPQPNQSAKGELQTERNEFELTGRIKNDCLPPVERSDVQQHTIASSKLVEDAPELKPVNGTEKILEPLTHENPPKTTELFDLEKTVTIELPEEKVAEVTAEESVNLTEESVKVLPEETAVTEAFQDPGQVLPKSR